MTTRPRYAGALAGLALLLTACGSAPDDTAEQPPPTPEGPSLEVPAAARPVLDDLAAQGVALADVDDVQVEAVTWSDASLGCAKPGEMYAQATVDGLRVSVTAGEQTFEYHQGGDEEPFLCERPSQ